MKLFMEHIGLCVCLLIFPELPALAQQLENGSAAPSFKVSSGDDSILTLDMIRGKIILLFYESRDVVEKNRALKNELNSFFQSRTEPERQQVVKLAVVDCTTAAWPFTGIWKCKLRKHSDKEGITIYGDWNGEMMADYLMKKNESNVTIIDKDGKIRLVFSGEIREEQTGQINALLDSLIDRQNSGE